MKDDKTFDETMQKAKEVDTYIKQIPAELNKTFSLLSEMANLKYNSLIFNLLKRGKVGVSDIEECTGIPRTTIYKMVNDFERFLKKQ